MYIDIQKNEENKLYSTTFVIGEGDKFYLPRWDTPKEYIRVPKGVIIYYPFNSEHLHGHIDSYNVRIEYDFKKVKNGLTYKKVGKHTYNEKYGLTPWNLPIAESDEEYSEKRILSYKYVLDEWANANYHYHMTLSPERLRVRGELINLRNNGYKEVKWNRDNYEETKPFVFESLIYKQKILKRLIDEATTKSGVS